MGTNKFKMYSWLGRVKLLTPVFIAGLSVSAGSYGQSDGDLKVDEFRVGITPLVESKNVKSIYFVNVKRDAAWSKSVQGNADRGNISVSLMGSGSSLNGDSLKLSFRNMGKDSLSASSCRSDGQCDRLSVSGDGNLKTVRFGGSEVQVRLDGIPCKDSSECELLYTSTGASQLLSNSSISDLPDYLGVIETSSEVLIINPSMMKVLYRLDSTDVVKEDGLGKVVKVELSDSGILDLGFEKGSVLLDFASDRVLAITSSGVFLSNEGLGDTYDMKFDSVYSHTLPDSNFVSYDKGYVVFTDGFVSLANYLTQKSSQLAFTSFGNGVKVTEARPGEDRIYIKRQSGTKVVAAYFDLKNSTVKSLGTDDVSMHMIASGGFYSFSKDTGVFFGATGGKSNTSFYNSQASVMLSRQGDSVLLKKEEQDTCRWEHFLRGTTSFNSFRETGVILPCVVSKSGATPAKVKAWMSTNDRFASVTMWDGSVAKVYVVFKENQRSTLQAH